eukprot:CAMPEP_0182815244 /NCGR_PEP_ID=MMETSP0006_2-20121128/10287_1 /TAXON_ID=97485 /ORGANISM="Prymnesium parvum, Strain Texoma1" /LENGTH=126 /DNA_ID=CAMNT_0024941429 /DNA_START=70 /DNA_END=450 /DNA_ORIENTATION=-
MDYAWHKWPHYKNYANERCANVTDAGHGFKTAAPRDPRRPPRGRVRDIIESCLVNSPTSTASDAGGIEGGYLIHRSFTCTNGAVQLGLVAIARAAAVQIAHKAVHAPVRLDHALEGIPLPHPPLRL